MMKKFMLILSTALAVFSLASCGAETPESVRLQVRCEPADARVSVFSEGMIVNANRLKIHALAYNIFNLFRRLVLPMMMQKDRIDTIRLKLFKTAVRIIRKARYLFFKLCSSCPFKYAFYETLRNITRLTPLLE